MVIENLLECVREGKNDEAIRIIESAQARDSINRIDDDPSRTLLHYAVNYNNTVITRYLIDRGYDSEAADSLGQTPLTIALTHGKAATISILLEARNENVNVDECIRLTANSFPSDLPTVRLLLHKLIGGCSSKNDIAVKLLRSHCPLAAVVCTFRSTELTKLMLDQGCAVDGRLASTGETALHLAVEEFDVGNVKLLVERGADVEARDDKGYTPLSRFKVGSGREDDKLEILRLLLDRGASPTANFFSRRDCYWLYYFFERETTVLNKLLVEADVRVLRLLVPFVDFCREDASGMTPLHYLVNNKNLAVLEILRDESFDVNARDSSGRTALDLAVRAGDLEKVRFLLEHGANPNNVDNDGNLALRNILLEFPKSKRAGYVFELLLLYDADPQLSTPKYRDSVFSVPVVEARLECAKLLLAHLAKLESFGVPLNESVDEKIKSNSAFRDYFDSCKLQLERMKATAVYESVTLYKLLSESPKRLIMYARNEKFQLKYESVKSEKCDVYSYYAKSINLRVDKAIIVAKMKNEAALAVCKITGLPVSTIGTIASYVVDCLSRRELEILSQV